jgi:glycosyltransferase involved in cell wall biosynthesis
MSTEAAASQRVPFVTLFTITYNQRELVLRTVEDAYRQEYPRDRFEVVVLDDGSSDGTTAALQAFAAGTAWPLKILGTEHESHYQSARRWNQCIEASSPRTEVFVQVDDVRLRPDFLRQHVKWHARGMYLVAGAKFEGSAETWELSACARARLAGPAGGWQTDIPATAVWGASMSYPRSILAAACGLPQERPFDEAMSGYGHHEVEFALRLQRAGARTVYDPAAGVFHRDHAPNEPERGLKRRQLVSQGLRMNAAYVCEKHGLASLPVW